MASEDVRRKIIDSATGQFIAHGCRRITMDDVAGELHISKRTLYEYFEKKEDLLMACFEQMKGKVGETICLFKTQCSSPILLVLHIYKYLSVYNAQLATLLNDIRDYVNAILRRAPFRILVPVALPEWTEAVRPELPVEWLDAKNKPMQVDTIAALKHGLDYCLSSEPAP